MPGITVSKKILEADLVITRKRKKWKFAHYNSWENCFTLDYNNPESTTEELKSYLPKDRKKVLELAAGNAQFSLELARRHPKTNFIAVDIKSDRMYTSAKKALAENIKNIAFVRTNINRIDGLLGENSVDEIWLTFPDPFPKKRSAKHRLTHPNFLESYKKMLKKSAKLKFKTDNRELFLWSLEQFVKNNWLFNELTFDLHDSDLSDDYKIKTYYEEKFTNQGIPTSLVTLSANQK